MHSHAHIPLLSSRTGWWTTRVATGVTGAQRTRHTVDASPLPYRFFLGLGRSRFRCIKFVERTFWVGKGFRQEGNVQLARKPGQSSRGAPSVKTLPDQLPEVVTSLHSLPGMNIAQVYTDAARTTKTCPSLTASNS